MPINNAPSQALQRLLLRGETLTPVRAALEFNFWRLSGLIHRLRRRGWPIESSRQHGNGMASYRLRAGWPPNGQNIPIDEPQTPA